MKSEDREKFDFDLIAPLPGTETKVSPLTTEAEGEAFMALMAMTRKEAAGAGT